MHKRLTAVALAGTVGLGAVGVAAYPALADNLSNKQADASSPQAQQERQSQLARRTAAIKEALKGLVDDKTLTQDQADKVAATLAQKGPVRGGPFAGRMPGGVGPGRPGGGLLGVEGPKSDEAAAKVLGLSVDELRTALRGGSTLAELAKKQGKSVDDLVDALVAAAKAQLADGVKDGRLTQETADRIEQTLEQRVRMVVQNGRPQMGPRGMKRGDDGQRPGRAPDGAGPGGETPAPPPTGTGSGASGSTQQSDTTAWTTSSI